MNSMNPRPGQGRFPTSPPPKPQYPPGSLPASHGKGDWAPFSFWQVTIFAVIMAIFSCVVNKTNTPDNVLIDMLNVDTHTALRGATWDGIQVFWRYYECSENADDIDLQVVYKYAE